MTVITIGKKLVPPRTHRVHRAIRPRGLSRIRANIAQTWPSCQTTFRRTTVSRGQNPSPSPTRLTCICGGIRTVRST